MAIHPNRLIFIAFVLCGSCVSLDEYRTYPGQRQTPKEYRNGSWHADKWQRKRKEDKLKAQQEGMAKYRKQRKAGHRSAEPPMALPNVHGMTVEQVQSLYGQSVGELSDGAGRLHFPNYGFSIVFGEGVATAIDKVGPAPTLAPSPTVTSEFGPVQPGKVEPQP